MGLNLGFGGGSTSSKTDSTATENKSSTFSPGQSETQGSLGDYFRKLLASLSSGVLSPQVQAQTTGTADTINKSFAATGDSLNRQLAERGFGQSGQTGKATLQTELARQGAQAGNLEAGASNQLQQNNASLLDALNYAFTNLGTSTSATGTTSGSGSGYGAFVGASPFKMPTTPTTT